MVTSYLLMRPSHDAIVSYAAASAICALPAFLSSRPTPGHLSPLWLLGGLASAVEPGHIG